MILLDGLVHMDLERKSLLLKSVLVGAKSLLLIVRYRRSQRINESVLHWLSETSVVFKASASRESCLARARLLA